MNLIGRMVTLSLLHRNHKTKAKQKCCQVSTGVAQEGKLAEGQCLEMRNKVRARNMAE